MKIESENENRKGGNIMEGKLRNMASLYLRDGDNMLLLYRMGSRVIKDSYIGTAGGHFEKDELNDAKKCVLRELYEETGLKEENIKNLTLRYVTLRQREGEIRQNYYFFADIADRDIKLQSNEGILKWFKYDELPGVDMPYTARYVINHFVEKGQYTNELYAGIASDDSVIFMRLNEF